MAIGRQAAEDEAAVRPPFLPTETAPKHPTDSTNYSFVCSLFTPPAAALLQQFKAYADDGEEDVRAFSQFPRNLAGGHKKQAIDTIT